MMLCEPLFTRLAEHPKRLYAKQAHKTTCWDGNFLVKKTENKAKSSAPEHFNLMIIGAGPSGLSAAVRAAEHEMSYVLLESELAPASTVRSYLRGKFVICLLYTSRCV